MSERVGFWVADNDVIHQFDLKNLRRFAKHFGDANVSSTGSRITAWVACRSSPLSSSLPRFPDGTTEPRFYFALRARSDCARNSPSKVCASIFTECASRIAFHDRSKEEPRQALTAAAGPGCACPPQGANRGCNRCHGRSGLVNRLVDAHFCSDMDA